MVGRPVVNRPEQPLGTVYFTDKLYSAIQLLMVGNAAGLIAVASGLKDIGSRPELLALVKEAAQAFAVGLLSSGLALFLLFVALFIRDKYLAEYEFAREVGTHPLVVGSSPSMKRLQRGWKALTPVAANFAASGLFFFGVGAVQAIRAIMAY